MVLGPRQAGDSDDDDARGRTSPERRHNVTKLPAVLLKESRASHRRGCWLIQIVDNGQNTQNKHKAEAGGRLCASPHLLAAALLILPESRATGERLDNQHARPQAPLPL